MARRDRTEGVVCKPRDQRTRAWETASLEEHAALIKRQIDRSLEDPELRELAQRVAIGRADPGRRHQGATHVTAWGIRYVLPLCDAPALNDEQEARLVITRIWNFVVSNWTYIEDPPSFDQFSTAQYVLDARKSAAILEKELPLETNDRIRSEMVKHIADLRRVETLGAGDCDDVCVLLVSLLKACGFRNCRARIVSTDEEFWAHVYTMVGVPRTQSRTLVALDPTVNGATPGWEYPRAKAVQDFIL